MFFSFNNNIYKESTKRKKYIFRSNFCAIKTTLFFKHKQLTYNFKDVLCLIQPLNNVTFAQRVFTGTFNNRISLCF